MNAIELLKRLHQHRAWVNGNLLTSAATLSNEQLRKEFQIGQGSVWQSLLHLYGAEYIWLETLLGNEEFRVPGDLPGQIITGNQQGEGGITDLAELRLKWSELEKRWTGYLAGLSSDALQEIVHRKSPRFGRINMLRHIGMENLPATMLFSLAMQEAK